MYKLCTLSLKPGALLKEFVGSSDLMCKFYTFIQALKHATIPRTLHAESTTIESKHNRFEYFAFVCLKFHQYDLSNC